MSATSLLLISWDFFFQKKTWYSFRIASFPSKRKLSIKSPRTRLWRSTLRTNRKNARRSRVRYYLARFSENGSVIQPAVKISLNDCLACNGCITSAETVLIEEQSIERLESKYSIEKTTCVPDSGRQSAANLSQSCPSPRSRSPRSQPTGRFIFPLQLDSLVHISEV